MRDVEKEGGKVLIGGKRRTGVEGGEGGNWVEPTIVLFEDGGRGKSVMRRETFAPSESISLKKRGIVLKPPLPC